MCLAHQDACRLLLHTPTLVRPCAAGRDHRRGRRIHAVSEPSESLCVTASSVREFGQSAARLAALHQTTRGPPLGCSFAAAGCPSWRKRCSPTRFEPSSSYIAKYKPPGHPRAVASFGSRSAVSNEHCVPLPLSAFTDRARRAAKRSNDCSRPVEGPIVENSQRCQDTLVQRAMRASEAHARSSSSNAGRGGALHSEHTNGDIAVAREHYSGNLKTPIFISRYELVKITLSVCLDLELRSTQATLSMFRSFLCLQTPQSDG